MAHRKKKEKERGDEMQIKRSHLLKKEQQHCKYMQEL